MHLQQNVNKTIVNRCLSSQIGYKIYIIENLFPAIKSNDNLYVIQALACFGAGFDCASKGEIAKTMSYGIGTDSIIYANPTKPR